MEKLAYSIREAAAAGAGSRTKLYEAIKSGALRAKKRGRSTIILAADLARYLEALPNFNDQETA